LQRARSAHAFPAWVIAAKNAAMIAGQKWPETACYQ